MSPASRGSVALGPLGVPLLHYSYVVDDLRAGAEYWAAKMNAGPFYSLGYLEADVAIHAGEPAKFTHSAAFGQWGSISIELQELHEVEPAILREKLDRPINHIAYVCSDAEADSLRMEGLGMPLLLDATFGPAHVRFHDCPMLGHAIELHQGSDYLYDFFVDLRQAAVGWDGSEPFREGLPGQ